VKFFVSVLGHNETGMLFWEGYVHLPGILPKFPGRFFIYLLFFQIHWNRSYVWLLVRL